ncbi:MAG: recombinase family protein [Gaiellaceae bacterium]
MSLSRNRRRKQEQRRHHETRPAPRTSAADHLRDSDAALLSPEQQFNLQRALDEPHGSALREACADLPDVDVAPPASPSSPARREVRKVERLAYTRRQAAEALGVSISTIDRRVVPVIETVKLPGGQRLIPVDELERFLRNHREPGRGRPPRRPAGRPPTLPLHVVERIRLEYARGRGLSEIARALTAEGVSTAHGGRTWWPSTVRAVLLRSRRILTRSPLNAGPYTSQSEHPLSVDSIDGSPCAGSAPDRESHHGCAERQAHRSDEEPVRDSRHPVEPCPSQGEEPRKSSCPDTDPYSEQDVPNKNQYKKGAHSISVKTRAGEVLGPKHIWSFPLALLSQHARAALGREGHG